VEWKSKALRAYQRRTMAADALIASSYLAGTNTRRVRRALAALFGGAIGKDVVSRTWRKVKRDWDAWNARSLADEPIVRLILDGTVVRVRLDRKATSISLLVVIGGNIPLRPRRQLLGVDALGDALKPEIDRVFAENFEVYGARKVWRQMLREGFAVALHDRAADGRPRPSRRHPRQARPHHGAGQGRALSWISGHNGDGQAPRPARSRASSR
jgi:hypothetical protein